MPRAKVFEVENPHVIVTLFEDLLKIDLKGSFRSEIEEAVENKPILKKTIGSVFSVFVPLHIPLRDIDSAHVDQAGNVTVSLAHHRNIVIPLERKENAEQLVEKLNHLVSDAKISGIRERVERKRGKRKVMPKSRGAPPSSYSTVPYYFPTEQADIVDKLRRNRKQKKK